MREAERLVGRVKQTDELIKFGVLGQNVTVRPCCAARQLLEEHALPVLTAICKAD